jgi:DNA-binding response OmpR family regulator
MERLANIEALASVPVIVFTARYEESHRERSLEAGAKAFFQKPVDPAELLLAVKQVLDGPNSMQPSLIPLLVNRPT